MRVITLAHGASHPVQLKAEIDAYRAGHTFLVVQDGRQRHHLFVLEPQDDAAWIGRGAECQVRIDWDEQASRCHAELRRVPGGWAIVDDGLSRNGTFVGGERVVGRRRLHDRDVIRCASSLLTYRLPDSAGDSTRDAIDVPAPPDLTPAQSRVLVALCRPLVEAGGHAVPASNPAIAAELFLSTEAVKTHVRALFAKFAIGDLPQNQKRARLAELAMQSGLVA